MPWNGAGVYSPPVGSFPESNGTVIDAVRFDATINDLATGITASLAKNGENIPTANLSMGGFKHTNAADAAAAGQYVAFAQATNAYVGGRWGAGVTPLAPLHGKGSGELMRLETTTARGSGTGYLQFNDPSGVKGLLGFAGGADDGLYIQNALNAAINFHTNGSLRMQITAAGVIQDASGNELGFKDLPFGSAKVAPYTIVAADRGTAIVMNTGSNVTIPAGLPANSVIVIYNNSGGALTLVSGGGVTLLLDGSTLTGNRTLANRGKAVLWCFSPPSYSIGGAGVS